MVAFSRRNEQVNDVAAPDSALEPTGGTDAASSELAQLSSSGPRFAASTRFSPHRDLPDEVLVEHVIAGDAHAFKELHFRYQADLERFCQRWVGRSDAADVVQDTFLALHLSAETFDTSRSFKAWIFTVAANKARDLSRRTSKHPLLTFGSAPVGEDVQHFLEQSVVSSDQSVASALENAEWKQVCLEKAYQKIEELPEHLRDPLLLHLGEVPYRTIALICEIPLGTVKSRLHAAWRALGVKDQERRSGESAA